MKNLSPRAINDGQGLDGSIVTLDLMLSPLPDNIVACLLEVEEAELNGLISSGVLMRPHEYISIGSATLWSSSLIDVVEARCVKISTDLGFSGVEVKECISLCLDHITSHYDGLDYFHEIEAVANYRNHSISVELLDKVRCSRKEDGEDLYEMFLHLAVLVLLDCIESLVDHLHQKGNQCTHVNDRSLTR